MYYNDHDNYDPGWNRMKHNETERNRTKQNEQDEPVQDRMTLYSTDSILSVQKTYQFYIVSFSI